MESKSIRVEETLNHLMVVDGIQRREDCRIIYPQDNKGKKQYTGAGCYLLIHDMAKKMRDAVTSRNFPNLNDDYSVVQAAFANVVLPVPMVVASAAPVVSS